MPELPEIWNLAQQMNETLSNKTIAIVDVRQEKCLNLPLDLFQQGLENRTLGTTTAKGKWVFTKISPDQNLLLNLGMGGLVLYLDPEQAKKPPRYRLKFVFSDRSALAIDFSWFGYVHLVGSLAEHAMKASLGPSPLEEDFTWDRFRQILAGRKGILKSVLLDQHAISGIGNVYVQDILFRARLHPLRKIPSLDEGEQRRLYQAIRQELQNAVDLGGLIYERDLFNHPGRFQQFQVGYHEGKPCPVCGSIIVKIRTSSTSSYICPTCQT
ncbi:MAG: Fpg/Nei family DNA glycosylase [Coprothermobacterota bacterium]|nr:Fpg/Nei family DNA glycosylase [Coprothermobacterota bacterium]